MKRRPLLLLLAIISAPSLPLGCLPLAMILRPISPMMGRFLTSFTVENRLDREIRITPIGTGHDFEMSRTTLPLYESRSSAVRAAEETDLRIGPGEVRTVVYDNDDVNLSEILIRTDEWRKVLIVDSPSAQNRHLSLEGPRFVIDASTRLIEPSAQVLKALEPHGESVMWVLTVLGVIGPLVFLFAVRQNLGLRRYGAPSTPDTGRTS